MNPIERLKKLFEVDRDVKEIERWMFSLAPLMVAFAFFVIFMFPVEMANKDVIYVIGLTAGFTGLQTYWIIRGWRRNEGWTVLLGIIGIALAITVAMFYVHDIRGLIGIIN